MAFKANIAVAKSPVSAITFAQFQRKTALGLGLGLASYSGLLGGFLDHHHEILVIAIELLPGGGTPE